MKYVIFRSSDYDIKPCENAIQEKLTKIVRSSFRTLKEARKLNGCGWFFRDDSFNHQETTDGCTHDCYEQFWTIEIDNIHDFIDKYGEIIIFKSDCREIPYKIEIYDSYRE